MSDARVPVFLTVGEVAERWRCSERHVRDEIGRKRLKATKPSREWLITLADVEAFERAVSNVRASPKRTRAPRRRVA